MGFAQQHKGSLTQEQAQHSESDTLHWSKNRKLTWDDFRGVPDTSTIYRAITFSGFLTQSKYTSDTTISVIISAVFYKQRSWVKDKFRDSLTTLNHEQGHFDITEVYARKSTAAFKKYKYNKTTVNKDIDSIFNLFANKQNEMHRLYDKQTTNPINYKKQKDWDKKIAMWLKENS